MNYADESTNPITYTDLENMNLSIVVNNYKTSKRSGKKA